VLKSRTDSGVSNARFAGTHSRPSGAFRGRAHVAPHPAPTGWARRAHGLVRAGGGARPPALVSARWPRAAGHYPPGALLRPRAVIYSVWVCTHPAGRTRPPTAASSAPGRVATPFPRGGVGCRDRPPAGRSSRESRLRAPSEFQRNALDFQVFAEPVETRLWRGSRKSRKLHEIEMNPVDSS